MALAMAPSVPAAGQTVLPDEMPDSVSLAGVSVTAIKQASSLIDQPVSVTTITRREIERYNISGMRGVSEIAPNFYMPEYGSRMTSSIYVRGIGARIDQAAVGLNVDNIPYLNKNGYDFDMMDIERIEVLRGPQSTLYGRNTIAGLINVYTLSPLRHRGVRLFLEGGFPAQYRIGASAMGPITDRLGMSFSAYVPHYEGYRRNDFNGKRAGESHDLSFRWKTVWQPSARLSIENVMSLGRGRQHGYPYASEETGRINYNDTCFYRRYTLSEGLTVSYTTPWFTVASITGLQLLNDNLGLDQDFLPQSYFTLGQRQHDRSATQDIVFRGQTGNYKWLAGVFGFYKHNRMWAPVTFKEDGIERLILDNVNKMLPPGMILKWDSPDFVLGSRFLAPSRGIAFYHRSTLTLGHFDLAAGIRFDLEHTTLSYASDVSTSATMYRTVAPGVEIPLGQRLIEIADGGRLRKTFREVLPNFSLTYRHRSSAFFASVSKGYKAGGFNTQMFSDILQQKMMEQMGQPSAYDVDAMVSYKPETSWNYEVGGHFSVDEGRVYSTFSAFLIDVRDQQVTVFPEGTTTGRMMANAGRARSMGVELTLRYAPARRWLFNLSYGYTRATFRKFDNGIEDLSGNRVPYAPSNTLFASATYTCPLKVAGQDCYLAFTPDVRALGSIYWDEENLHRQPFYAELGASLRFGFPYGSVELWGKNLTDTRFNVFRYESIGHSFFQRGAPLRGGMTVRLNFDLPDD